MGKIKKIQFSLESYGIYSLLDKNSADLPRILHFTKSIPVSPDCEFGLIARFLKSKGEWIDFEIEHPPWKDEHNQLVPNFSGRLPIKTNDYRLFVGDTFWEPFSNKSGTWTIKLWHKKSLIEKIVFEMSMPTGD